MSNEVNDPQWWRDAVVYQVYLRSFADGNGDGIGDLAGVRARLDHLTSLGVDAIWINPWYRSPQRDAGYDVADFRRIEPAYGTLPEAEALIAEAHDRGIRVLLDLVPNHTSSEHAWFRAAWAGDRDARHRYVIRSGRERPNDWKSVFGGPAWSRIPGADGGPDEWYLHMFAPGQPDLNWDDDTVRADFEDVLRFWFDRGVDGFRIDVAHGLVKEDGLPDAGDAVLSEHPAWDRDGVHEIYRSWRKIADSYSPPRVFVAEAWVSGNDRLARYLRPDELHTAFQFDFLRAPWRAGPLRRVIDEAIDQAADVGAPPTWVLANHDVVRTATRYARHQPKHMVESEWERGRWGESSPDLELGRRRARAAAMLEFALPGTAYVYQGDELGLDEVEDIPAEQRQDPTWEQSGRTDPGRDGCRVPLPWSGEAPPYGFSPSGVSTLFPQPEHWKTLTVERQDADDSSTLNLYRRAIRLRRELFGAEPLRWIESATDGVLAFRRGVIECWVNLSCRPIALPEGEVVLASAPVEDGRIPADAAAWLLVPVREMQPRNVTSHARGAGAVRGAGRPATA